MNNCEICNSKGWVIAEGRLGDEIQVCQNCFRYTSDKQAYQKASLEIDVSNFKYDNFVFNLKENGEWKNG